MKISQHAHFAQIILALIPVDDSPPTPSIIGSWANDNEVAERSLLRAETLGIDTSAARTLFKSDDMEDFEGRLSSWSNAVDVERKYGLKFDEPVGWIALLWAFVDVVWTEAGDVDATWDR